MLLLNNTYVLCSTLNIITKQFFVGYGEVNKCLFSTFLPLGNLVLHNFSRLALILCFRQADTLKATISGMFIMYFLKLFISIQNVLCNSKT